jgi:uncharacterized membrane protein YfcA
MHINATLLAIVILSFLIAFIFSMFGQGGGSVFSPLLILFGYSILISSSTSLVLNLITSLAAGFIFYRKKMIDYKTSFLFAPGISLGAFAGGAFSKRFAALGLQLPFLGKACIVRRLIAWVRPTLQLSDPTTSARCPTARRKCGWGWDGGEGIL